MVNILSIKTHDLNFQEHIIVYQPLEGGVPSIGLNINMYKNVSKNVSKKIANCQEHIHVYQPMEGGTNAGVFAAPFHTDNGLLLIVTPFQVVHK